MESEIIIFFVVLVFSYVLSRVWNGARFSWRMKQLARYELNDILTNEKYRVKGRNE